MSTPKTKRGYRPLAVGETIQAGDLIYFASRFQPVENFKGDIGKVIQELSYRYCRPLGQPAAPTICWHYLPEKPDDEHAVLVAVMDCHDACEGYCDGENWFFQGGMLIDAEVYAWAELPDCPPVLLAKKGGRS